MLLKIAVVFLALTSIASIGLAVWLASINDYRAGAWLLKWITTPAQVLLFGLIIYAIATL